MKPDLKGWYEFVHSLPCAACGAHGVEAAHMRVILSSKTGDRLPRSHKGRAAWGCLPLCKPCHLEQHTIGEYAFADEHRLDYTSIIATNLVRFFVERE